VVLALREAAASDADLAERRRHREQQRRINVEQGAALVAGRAVTAEEVDGLWALVAVEVYQMLTELRGGATAAAPRRAFPRAQPGGLAALEPDV
jgi:hypothetical protein